MSSKNEFTEEDLGKIKNLTHLSGGDGKGWAWDVVEQGGHFEADLLREYFTNDAGEGLWITEEDYDGSPKHQQIEGTCDFGTAYGKQTRAAIRGRLTRYFAEKS